jgi:sugar-specific transcriptional regulator TrmB
MQNYKEKLSTLDEDNSEELISNGSKKHAQALIYQFLDGAKNSVNIISKNLSIYNNQEIVEALNVALTKGVQIKILLDDYQNDKIIGNIFLDKCIKDKNCKIKTYSEPLKAHIVTRDSSAFRYCNSPGSNIAVASFNNPDVVKNAKEKVFGTFFEDQPVYAA